MSARRRHASRPTSRSSSARSTASGSCTSTPRRRRRSRIAVLDAMDALLPRLLRQRPPRRVHDRRGGDRGVRGGARARSRGFVDARAHERDRVHAQRDRGDQPRRVHVGAAPTCARATRSCSRDMEHHANVVPWHILAAERGVELRWIPLTDDFRLDLTDLDRAPRRRQAARGHARCRTCSARSTTSGRSPTPPHAAGALVLVDACQAVPHVAVDVQAWDADFVAFTGAQDARPDRHRRAVGPRRAARGDAAVPRRRRDDPRRPHRRLHHQRRAVEVRGGHACRSPRRSASAPRSTTSSALGMDAVRDHEMRAHRGTRSTRSRDRFGDTLTIYGPTDVDDARRRGLVPVRRHPRPRHLARSSTRTPSASAPATTAPSR